MAGLVGRQSARVFNDDKLEAFFRSLSRSEKYQMVMEAYQEATTPLTDQAKANLIRGLQRRSRTMNLYGSIGMVKATKTGNSNYIEAKVGARKYKPFKGFHGHLIDAGTQERHTRQGFNRGKVRGTHFFTNAVASTHIKVTEALKAQITARVKTLIEQKMNELFTK